MSVYYNNACVLFSCIEPNNESPLNVDAAELWENQAGMRRFFSVTMWTKQVCHDGSL